MGKLYRASTRGPTSALFSRSLEDGHRGPGRPSIDDQSLSADRDALVWLLSVTWHAVGWQLPQAKSLQELRHALEPVRGHAYEHYVTPFLRQTSVTATAQEIRVMRKKHGEAVERLREVQTKYDKSEDASRLVEAAMDEDKSRGTSGPMVVEAFKRWGKGLEALRELESARAGQNAMEEELKDKEAGVAQNELLDFITQRKYARNALGFANAMAGLPEMTWQQSFARCSKLKCGQWPSFPIRLFDTIKKIWNHRKLRPELSLVQLFQREIEKLPKKIIISIPQPPSQVASLPAGNDAPDLSVSAASVAATDAHTDTTANASTTVRVPRKAKVENPIRSYLAENWRYLRLAIDEIGQAEIDPDRMPFIILTRFSENVAKPRTAQELILAETERIRT